jgi:hypothetical protein
MFKYIYYQQFLCDFREANIAIKSVDYMSCGDPGVTFGWPFAESGEAIQMPGTGIPKTSKLNGDLRVCRISVETIIGESRICFLIARVIFLKSGICSEP